jgi:hypothetical protein
MGGRVQFVWQSSTCRRQVGIEIPTGSGTGQVSHPRRACGSEMKKAYSKPAFRILSKEEAVLRLGDYGPQKSSGKSAV